MPIFDGWIIRAVADRLRQPEMRTQRRFMIMFTVLMVLVVLGSLYYLYIQTTEDAIDQAAVHVLIAMGVMIAILIIGAIVIRKRTNARWEDVTPD